MADNGYALIAQLRMSGMSYREIGAQCKVSSRTIGRALRAFGIPTGAIRAGSAERAASTKRDDRGAEGMRDLNMDEPGDLGGEGER